MKCECISCLCNFCTKTNCRYTKARCSSVCNIRCIHISDTVTYNYKPVLLCDKFQHAVIHKRYKITAVQSQRKNALATISLKDFLSLLGGGGNNDN